MIRCLNGLFSPSLQSVLIPLSSRAVNALAVDSVFWLHWTRRLDEPDVIAATSAEERTYLRQVAHACEQLHFGHRVIGSMHTQGRHDKCREVQEQHLEVIRRIGKMVEDYVSSFKLIDTNIELTEAFQQPTGIYIRQRPAETTAETTQGSEA